MVLVMLLIGEIPERSLFRAKEFEKVLLPYMRLTKGFFFEIFPLKFSKKIFFKS